MNILKSLPAQQKALEDKKDYEKKLKEIQDLCLEIYKLSREYEDYLINATGNFKTPNEIKNDIYSLGDRNFEHATKDALAYIQVEKLPKITYNEYWLTDNGDVQGGDLEYSMENFESEIADLKTDFYTVTSSLSYSGRIATPKGDASLEYNRFSDYLKYYKR